MTAAVTADWDRKDDGGYIAVPIAGHDSDEVRAWFAENCGGDYLIVLGQRVVFERREDAAGVGGGDVLLTAAACLRQHRLNGGTGADEFPQSTRHRRSNGELRSCPTGRGAWLAWLARPDRPDMPAMPPSD